MKEAGTLRLNRIGPNGAFTCLQTRLETSHYTARGPRWLKLAPGSDRKEGNGEISLCYFSKFFPRETAACAQAAHTNKQCARGKVLSGGYL